MPLSTSSWKYQHDSTNHIHIAQRPLHQNFQIRIHILLFDGILLLTRFWFVRIIPCCENVLLVKLFQIICKITSWKKSFAVLEAYSELCQTFKMKFFAKIFTTGLAKWISKCRSHEKVKTTVGHHGWPTRTVFEF